MATADAETGIVTKLAPLRHHKHYQPDASGKTSPYAGGSSFMERVAEGVASGMGTVAFVVIGSLIILGWVLINGAIPYFEHTFTALAKGGQFDREPWILLNLIFSGSPSTPAHRDHRPESTDANRRRQRGRGGRPP